MSDAMEIMADRETRPSALSAETSEARLPHAPYTNGSARQNYRPSALEVCSTDFHNEFLSTLEVLLKTGVAWEAFKYCYSPIVTAPDGSNGAARWDNTVRYGDQSGYTIPNQERLLVEHITEALSEALSSVRPFGLMAGPGTSLAVLIKEEPTWQSVDASGIAAWDLNPIYAEQAARLIGEDLGISHQSIIGDFSRPIQTKLNLESKTPILISMYGSTLSQFPLSNTAGTSPTLPGLLDNFAGLSKQSSGLFFMPTIDANLREGPAIDCYNGRHFTAFQNHFWELVKYMTGWPYFNPKAIVYMPRFDEKNRVIHEHFVREDTNILVNGEMYNFRKGDTYQIGASQKWDWNDVKPTFAQKQWPQIAGFRNEGTVRAGLYAHESTPGELVQRVQEGIRRKMPEAVLGL